MKSRTCSPESVSNASSGIVLTRDSGVSAIRRCQPAAPRRHLDQARATYILRQKSVQLAADRVAKRRSNRSSDHRSHCHADLVREGCPAAPTRPANLTHPNTTKSVAQTIAVGNSFVPIDPVIAVCCKFSISSGRAASPSQFTLPWNDVMSSLSVNSNGMPLASDSILQQRAAVSWTSQILRCATTRTASTCLRRDRSCCQCPANAAQAAGCAVSKGQTCNASFKAAAQSDALDSVQPASEAKVPQEKERDALVETRDARPGGPAWVAVRLRRPPACIGRPKPVAPSSCHEQLPQHRGVVRVRSRPCPRHRPHQGDNGEQRHRPHGRAVTRQPSAGDSAVVTFHGSLVATQLN